MKKLFLLLLFIPIVCFGQEDIERFKIYDTSNSYIYLKLDTMTGKTWMVQIDLGDGRSLDPLVGVPEEYFNWNSTIVKNQGPTIIISSSFFRIIKQF